MTPSVSGSAATMTSAPCSCAARASTSSSSIVPRKFGCWRMTADTSSVERFAQRVEIGEAVGERDLLDGHRVADGERAQGLAAVGVHAAADEQARAALVRGLRKVRGGRDGARALVREALATGSPVSSEIAVWYSA